MNKIKCWFQEHQKVITISFIIVAFVAVMLPLISLGYDYWWHLKTGEYILETKSIPVFDIFSWYKPLPWISHEWLSEIILVFFKKVFGSWHVIIYCLTSLFLLFFLLYHFLKKKMNDNLPFTILFLFIGVLIIGGGVTPRPHMLSHILFLTSIYLVYDLYQNQNSKKIYFLPVITVLWANLHGGSSNLPYILCFIFFVLGLFQFTFGRIEAKRFSKLQLKKYLLIGFLCIIATTLNPHGISMLIYPYQNIQNTFMQSIITEWNAPNINLFSHFPIFLLIIVIIIVFLTTKKKVKFVPFLITCIFLALTLKSIRFAPYLFLASGFALFPYLEEITLPTSVYVFSCIVSLLLIGNSLYDNIDNCYKKVNTQLLSENIITYLKKEEPKRLYNYYDYGGYLLYRDIPVFVDGRADIYSNHTLEDFYNLLHLRSNSQAILENYNFDYFIIPRDTPLTFYLQFSNDYTIELEENDIVIFKSVK